MASINASTSGAGGVITTADNTGILNIQTAGTTAVTVDASQNVGIGTSSPYTKLQVNGVVRAATDNDKGVIGLGESGANNNTVNCGFWRGGANSAVNTSTGVVTTGGNFLNIGGYDGIAFTTGAAAIGSQTERMRLDTSGNLQFNSGYGSVATAYGCRAWVNFNGSGTVAIRASGNVSSITDNGQGLYTVNFTTSMPDVNYAAFVTANPSKVQIVNLRSSGTYSTSAVQVNIFGSDTADYDAPIVNVSVFR